MAPKIAIVYYSMYGHIKQLVRLRASDRARSSCCIYRSRAGWLTRSKAEAEKKGIESAGGSAKLFQYVYRSEQNRLSRRGASLASVHPLDVRPVLTPPESQRLFPTKF
jgi:hypothetical protein